MPDPVIPGGSALQEYHRRRRLREQRERGPLGSVGVAIARLASPPAASDAWRAGATERGPAAQRLDKQLAGRGVVLLHARRIPGSDQTIDHLAIGPGGVTVVDAQKLTGKVALQPSGRLYVGDTDRTILVQRLVRQAEAVRNLLDELGYGHVQEAAALCLADGAGLPLLKRLQTHGVLIDVPRRVADLAARPGLLSPDVVEWVRKDLAAALPPA